jgi:hypothetical protein
MPMKKIFLFLLCAVPFVGLFGQAPGRLYALSFPSLHQTTINMSDYRGKKMLIAVYDVSHPDKDRLSALASLSQGGTGLIVLVVPVSDVDVTGGSPGAIDWWRDSLPLSCIATGLSQAKKQAGPSQHPLLQWITHVTQNGHFDNDIAHSGELFMVSEAVVLYACIKSKIALDGPAMTALLAQQAPDK